MSRWDAENRLVQIDYPGSGNNSQFVYDPLDHVVKIIETTASSIVNVKQFVWLRRQMREARDGSGALMAQYFSRGQTIGGANYFYTRSREGSVRELADSSGNIQAAYAYDMFGRVTKLLGSLSSDFQYAGYYLHAPSGLSIAVYRAYTAPALFPNSASGRFRHLHPPYAKNHINVVAIDFYPLHESSNHVPLRFEIERLQICQYV